MAQATPDFQLILETLVAHQVDFIVVGGVGAVLHGAPLHTVDLDIVHSRASDNLNRLLAALQDLDAYYRFQGGRIIRPRLAYLETPGHQLLMTRAGAFDVLGTIGTDQGYEELLPHTVEVQLDGDLRVKILDLPLLIQLKEQAGRDKDRMALPVLRRTLEEKRKKG